MKRLAAARESLAAHSRATPARTRRPGVGLRLEPLEPRRLLTADWMAGFDTVSGRLSIVSEQAGADVRESISPRGFVELQFAPAGATLSSDPASSSFEREIYGATADTLTQIDFRAQDAGAELDLADQTLTGSVLVTSTAKVDVVGQVTAAGFSLSAPQVTIDGALEGANVRIASDDVLSVAGGGRIALRDTSSGGTIRLDARLLINAGQISANGDSAGSLELHAQSMLNDGQISATGQTGGGSIELAFAGSFVETRAGSITASATVAGNGGRIVLDGGPQASLFSSGQHAALGRGENTLGGALTVEALRISLVGSSWDVSGTSGAGAVRIGGGAHGSDPGLRNAQTVYVDAGTQVIADAWTNGPGGTIDVWADGEDSFAGRLSARAGAAAGAGATGSGGTIEISAGGQLDFAGSADAGSTAGAAGRLLLDPKNIVVSSSLGLLPQFNLVDPNPNAGGQFGAATLVLATGNIVVTDPNDNFGAANAGAVYLFDGTTGALISSLVGSQANDQVGSAGLNPALSQVGNGNFTITSSTWDNGAAVDAGAVTWASGTAGVSGAVSATNSLVGSTSNDQLGTTLTVLANGNYVVGSPHWTNANIASAGAATFGKGNAGIVGKISNLNSLVGTHFNDSISDVGVVALANGNYVVQSSYWRNGAVTTAGAVTFGNGNTGVVGNVSANNSLVGSTVGDRVGGAFSKPNVIALPNGNYLVRSVYWDNGAAVDAGAITWASGTTGVNGPITAANSLVGSTSGDQLGLFDIVVLPNSNYVVDSAFWDNGPLANAGAVTWASGSTGITGTISAANSLVGTTAGDLVGGSGVVALTNGNYVVASQQWHNGTTAGAGGVTWANGLTGIRGAVSTANSLVGTQAGDNVGGAGVTALKNGNYVVQSPNWSNGAIQLAGAVTWANGLESMTGQVSPANSLVGSTPFDKVGSVVTPLANGNYVVRTPTWDNQQAVDAGAATWGSGTVGVVGAITAANSLVGTQTNDVVAGSGVAALANGNYVVLSEFWDRDNIVNTGAATMGDGSVGVCGAVSAFNSLVGSQAGDFVGNGGVIPLSGGNFVVRSLNWANATSPTAGAVTWENGQLGLAGPVTPANSLVGSNPFDAIGVGGVTPLANGNYVVRSSYWQNGAVVHAGAVTWGAGTSGVNGPVSASNSVVGSSPEDLLALGGVKALSDGGYAFSTPKWDAPGLADAGEITWCDGATGATLDGNSAVTPRNSILGHAAATGLSAVSDDGVHKAFVASFVTEGGGRVTVGFASPSQATFARMREQSLTITPDLIARTLNTGTAIVLQASNDITIQHPITASPTGPSGGALTLQAGRSLLVNAAIATAGGALTLIANDTLASGVVDADRDPGAALISAGTLNAGTGAISVQMRDGAGRTNRTSGAISLGSLLGGPVSVINTGPTAGSDIILGSATAAGPLALSSAVGGVQLTAPVSTTQGGAVSLTSAQTLALLSGASITADGPITQNGPGPVTLAGGLATTNDPISLAGAVVLISDQTVAAGTAGITLTDSLNLAGHVLQLLSGSPVQLPADTELAAGTLVSLSGVTVGAADVLRGPGAITGALYVSSGGQLYVGGAGPGSIDLTGNLTLASGAAFSVNLNGTLIGQFDRLNVTGAVNLGASAVLSATLGYVPAAGDHFVIIANDGTDPVQGSINGLPDGGVISISGSPVHVRYAGGDGNDVELRVNTAPSLNTAVTTSLAPIGVGISSAANVGTPIDTLVATPGLYSDADGLAQAGIAVVGDDQAHGVWQYTTNAGSMWSAIGAPTPAAALLLAADGAGQNRVRFVPAAGFAGTVNAGLLFRGWDRATGLSGSIADATAAGGTSAFSPQIKAASIQVQSGGFAVSIGQGGATPDDETRPVAVDATGNSYVAGTLYYADATDDSFTTGAGDIYIAKYTPAGALVWQLTIGGSGDDRGYGLALDAQNNVFVTGTFQGTVDFDPGAGTSTLTSTGGYDLYVLKLDTSGNYQWAVDAGSSSAAADVGYAVAVDATGSAIVTGQGSGSFTLTPTSGAPVTIATAGQTDIIVAKLNPTGGLAWLESLGGPKADRGTAVATDPAGGIYLTGSFSATADFDPSSAVQTLTSSGATDIFVARLNSDGSLSWAKKFGGAQADEGLAIGLDPAGNVYTTGYFRSTADFDPSSAVANLTSAGNTDIFLSKLDAAGNYLFANRMGATGDDRGRALVIQPDGDVAIAGSFAGRVDFDPGAAVANQKASGLLDVFVARYTATGAYVASLRSGGTAVDIGRAIATDANNSLYEVGQYSGVSTFNTVDQLIKLTSAGGKDMFLTRIQDPAGTTNAQAAAVAQSTQMDANRDDIISPLDALLVINRLNQLGSGPASAGPDADDGLDLDTTGDGLLSPLDALRIINYLNAPVRTAATISPASYDLLWAVSAQPSSSDYVTIAGSNPLDPGAVDAVFGARTNQSKRRVS